MYNQLETFIQGENVKTGIREVPIVDISSPDTYNQSEETKTGINSEEDKSTIVYKFGEYEVEVKLDSEGRFLYIKGHLTPKQKKYYKELFCVDEEFPKRPLE